MDDSSKLSPWLAHGCLSPRALHDAVRRYESARGANESTYWMRFELLWRDYFRFAMAKHGDLFFRAGGLVDARIAWKDDPDAFECWRTGHTGYPLVDAAMRELAVTGYTSNRARQNVASFLTKNLGIDWRLGAAWFESQLVDYDEQPEAELARSGVRLGVDYPRPIVHFRTSAAACEEAYEAGMVHARRKPGANARG